MKILLPLLLLISLPSFAQLATVTVSSTPAYQVPNDFMGISVEWDNPTYGGRAQELMGTTATGVDAPFRQLIQNLNTPAPIVIRVGGNSTDFVNSADDVTAFAQFYQALGNTFTLGVGLKNITPTQSQAIAQAYVAAMPSGSLRALEVGNEPDDYASWTFPQYATAVSAWINAVGTSVPFVYPSCGWYLCGNANWNTYGIAEIDGTFTHDYSIHYYATYNGSSATSGYLLSSAAYSVVPAIVREAKSIHRLGLRFRIDEMNTASGGGYLGISNAYESSLWTLDTLLDLASNGIDGVNIHGCWIGTSTSMCNSYDPATIKFAAGTPNTFTLVQVWPMYYGMQAFQEALGSGNAKIYPTTVTAGTSSSVDAYDVIDSSGAERAVVINRDTVNSGNVNFTPTATYTNATCYTLSGPAVSSTTGVTLHGQTYDGSTDGRILGTYTTSTITPSSGVYSIPLAVAQAQICKFNP